MSLRRRRAELLDRLDYRRRERSFDRLKRDVKMPRHQHPADQPKPELRRRFPERLDQERAVASLSARAR